MGEIAEMMLDGSLCQECGGVIGDGNGEGYPVTCLDCLEDKSKQKPKQKKHKQKMKRYPCEICGKSFAVMAQHLYHAHGINHAK